MNENDSISHLYESFKVEDAEKDLGSDKEASEIVELLSAQNKELEDNNAKIIQADVEPIIQNTSIENKETTLKEIKDRIEIFPSKTIELTARKKIVSGVLSTLAITSMSLGYMANLKSNESIDTTNSEAINSPHIEQIDSILGFNENLDTYSQVEISSNNLGLIDEDISILETDDTQSHEESELLTQVDGVENYDKNYEYDIPSESLRIVDSQNPISETTINQEVIPNLVKISDVSSEIWVLNEDIMIHRICLENLEEMFSKAISDGVSMYIKSGFRSFSDQEIAFNQARDKSVVTVPGTSQHHTGLAIDFTTPEINNVIDVNANFGETTAGKWLSENAWKYGFVLSYTNNHDGVSNEDWHYYFVGNDLAEIWHKHQLSGNNVDLFDLQLMYGN